MLTSAVVAGFLQEDKDKFTKVARGIPDFAVGLLREVQTAGKSVITSKEDTTFKGPNTRR